jgi:hypothetical protein
MRNRQRNQKGQEILEFAIFSVLMVPLFLWMVVAGLNLIRANQVNSICRDLTDMYIHGADFSTYTYQQLAQRLATGLGLQIGSSFSGNSYNNSSNGGNGLITAAQIMYVGATTDSNCVAVTAALCANHDSFVYIQRIQFGEATLNTSFAGTPSASMSISSSGNVQNFLTDTNAALPTQAQSDMKARWQNHASGTTPLVDGQVIYMVETYFKTMDFSFGTGVQGVYARYFF